MSTQILNFKKVEIVAESKEAAVENMEQNYFHYYGDATQAYRIWKEKQGGAVTERDLKEFMLNYLTNKTKCGPNAGFLITLDPAVKDTRLRPYSITNVKNEDGARKKKKQYVWIDKTTGEVLGKVDTNKAAAANFFKELCKNGYTGKARCEIQYHISEGNAVVMEGEYAPSKSTKKGTYLAFGIEA